MDGLTRRELFKRGGIAGAAFAVGGGLVTTPRGRAALGRRSRDCHIDWSQIKPGTSGYNLDTNADCQLLGWTKIEKAGWKNHKVIPSEHADMAMIVRASGSAVSPPTAPPHGGNAFRCKLVGTDTRCEFHEMFVPGTDTPGMAYPSEPVAPNETWLSWVFYFGSPLGSRSDWSMAQLEQFTDVNHTSPILPGSSMHLVRDGSGNGFDLLAVGGQWNNSRQKPVGLSETTWPNRVWNNTTGRCSATGFRGWPTESWIQVAEGRKLAQTDKDGWIEVWYRVWDGSSWGRWANAFNPGDNEQPPTRGKARKTASSVYTIRYRSPDSSRVLPVNTTLGGYVGAKNPVGTQAIVWYGEVFRFSSRSDFSIPVAP
jgi:hypothetical protein